MATLVPLPDLMKRSGGLKYCLMIPVELDFLLRILLGTVFIGYVWVQELAQIYGQARTEITGLEFEILIIYN